MNLVNNTEKRTAIDWEAINIVCDEAQVYFEGDKGLDEIADIIQDRVKTYVNENR